MCSAGMSITRSGRGREYLRRRDNRESSCSSVLCACQREMAHPDVPVTCVSVFLFAVVCVVQTRAEL